MTLSNPNIDGAREAGEAGAERPSDAEAQPAPVMTRRARREAEAATAAASTAPKRSNRAARERSGHRRGRTLAVVLVVPALIGTVALPAYALAPGAVANQASEHFTLARAEAQDVRVSTFAAAAEVSRAGYSAVSAEEIREAAEAAERAAREQEAAAARAANGGGSYAVLSEQAEGDDYPWWFETPDDYGGGLSPLRYYFRECVDFVAWRLNRDAGVTSAPWKWDWASLGAGSAYSWADAWYRKGWPVSSEPVVGAVAYFNYNHVAYVQSIPGDGTVIIEEYNQNSDHSYHVRQIGIGEAMYLYPPG